MLQKIIPENAFEQNKTKPALKFNPGLGKSAFKQLGPGFQP